MTCAKLLALLNAGWLTVGCVGQVAAPQDPGPAGTRTTGMAGIPGPVGTTPAGTTPGNGAPASGAAAYQVPFVALAHLGRREYDNTIRDLFGDTSSPARAFGADPAGPSGYEATGAIGALEADAYQSAAERIAANAVGHLKTLYPCAGAVPLDEGACSSQIVQSLAPRAFRRPVTADETADLLGLFRSARQDLKLSFADSVGVVFQAVPQAPSFLYHREIGPDRAVVEGDAVRLTAYEMASRLSYFLTGTTPDEALYQAAASGQLLTSAGLTDQARRLVSKPSALSETFVDFARQWLDLDPSAVEKSKTLFPDFASMRPLLWGETARFLGVAVDGGLGIEAVLTDPSVYVTKTSARLYGLTPPASDSLVKMLASTTQRAGLLTQLSFLAVHATASESHPVKRGKAVWADLLCGTMPPPPPNVPEAGAPQPNQTTRERFAAHAMNPCASCHKLMDPFGFAFETYDAVGQFRTTEAGKPIDASGSVTLPSGAALTFTGAVDLMGQLARSSDVTSCLARQLARYGTGTVDGPDEVIGRELLQLAGGGRKITDLLLSVVGTRAFRYRKITTGEVL